jgi:GNAT superfamily N-acetyltransferase
MAIEIKRLAPELSADYFDFFDNRAFSDSNPNEPCYCTSPTMDTSTERQMVSEFERSGVKVAIRKYAVQMLEQGQIHGYLAFDSEVPVGWCNAGDMDNYCNENWISDFIRQNACGKTVSVVCFAIAPEYRGKGVASALLELAIDDAKTDGFAAVEGYPRLHSERETFDYNGPVRLFEKFGFVIVAELNNVSIMRREL